MVTRVHIFRCRYPHTYPGIQIVQMSEYLDIRYMYQISGTRYQVSEEISERSKISSTEQGRLKLWPYKPIRRSSFLVLLVLGVFGKMGWDWWQRICEHNLHLRVPSPHPSWSDFYGFFKNKWHHQAGLLCGAALPGGLFSWEKTGPWCFCDLKLCFLHSTKTIFNGTRLDRRGLKS